MSAPGLRPPRPEFLLRTFQNIRPPRRARMFHVKHSDRETISLMRPPNVRRAHRVPQCFT